MSDHAYAIIGMGLIYVVAFMVVASIALGLVWLALAYWPRVHVGAPRNPLHWICYDARTILTAKGGGVVANPKPKLIHDYDVRWWIGLSCRRKPSWWFGFVKVSDTYKD